MMSCYIDQIRSMGHYVRLPQTESPPAGMPRDRAAIYGELVFNAISGLLATNLPVTKRTLGDEAWQRIVGAFLAAKSSQTPYFHRMAAEFSAFIDGRVQDPPYLADLVHFESLQLEVETADDHSSIAIPGWHLAPNTRIAVYSWTVSEPGDFRQEAQFFAIARNAHHEVTVIPLMPIDFAVLDALATAGSATVDALREAIVLPDALKAKLDGGWLDSILVHYGRKGITGFRPSP